MREKFIEGNVYHLLSRGVDRREIFLDDEDRLRFVHDLFEFNNANPITNVLHRFKQAQSMDIARPYITPTIGRQPRKFIVELLAFALMPNHYHLLVRPKCENGVQKFMKRLNMGYAKYFNDKNQRTGALFEGRYRSMPVTKDEHFIHLPYYIHFNPLDLSTPEWRNRKMIDVNRAVKFLEQYRWSSFQDYIGKKNFPSVTQREFLTSFIGGSEEYRSNTIQWLKDLEHKGAYDNEDISLE